MARFLFWAAFAVAALLAGEVLCQDEFDLADALGVDDPTPTQKPKAPAGGGPAAGGGFDLSDFFEKATTKAPPPQAPTKAPVKPKPKPDDLHTDLFGATVRPGLLPRTTAKAPRTTSPPRRAQPAADDFDLMDALDPNNDIGGKDKNKGNKGFGDGDRGDSKTNIRGGNGGGQFTDDDLADIGKGGGYNPDKGRGGSKGGMGSDDLSDNDYEGSMAETGTIAGIVSAVAMALVGAVSSYISYQKKKFCFSIQQSLNADMVKAENPEAVVAQEPPVQETLLQPPSAEPPTEENAV
ncbi:CD99 antigen-like protein 2 isoform X1 [Denticeps clupeoides]|uniref:CD99 antigen-like protein 2 n=1 Tax=Denticeps clupeoides TaxID=299321 RepID=A0AAY4BKM7_9TELE|nr:CD99 antigen-like protein 2 isoform X1 [Denticeps clupeoides]